MASEHLHALLVRGEDLEHLVEELDVRSESLEERLVVSGPQRGRTEQRGEVLVLGHGDSDAVPELFVRESWASPGRQGGCCRRGR